MRRSALSLLATATTFGAIAAPAVLTATAHAASAPLCAGAAAPTTLVRDGRALENTAFDASGRLIYDDLLSGKVRALDGPGAQPRTIATLIAPGGIVTTGDAIAVVQGNTVAPLIGGATLFRVDPATGARTRLATGFIGANGLARAADGTTYGSDTPTGVIDRIAPDGTVTRGWWKNTGGPNGLALSPDGRTLYANLSLGNRVVAIDTATRAVRIVARIDRPLAVPDGLTLDAAGQLYVALYAAGEVRRVDAATGAQCVLARGLRTPTAVAIGPGTRGFGATTAYVTTYGGVRAIGGAVPVAAAPAAS